MRRNSCSKAIQFVIIFVTIDGLRYINGTTPPFAASIPILCECANASLSNEINPAFSHLHGSFWCVLNGPHLDLLSLQSHDTFWIAVNASLQLDATVGLTESNSSRFGRHNPSNSHIPSSRLTSSNPVSLLRVKWYTELFNERYSSIL